MGVRETMNSCAAAVEAAAAHLKEAGVGGHAVRGHQAVLARMSNGLRAAGAISQIPHTFDDNSIYAGASGSRFAELPAQVRHLATKAEVDLGTDGTTTIEALDASMSKAGLPTSDRFTLKTALIRAGRIAA